MLRFSAAAVHIMVVNVAYNSRDPITFKTYILWFIAIKKSKFLASLQAANNGQIDFPS